MACLPTIGAVKHYMAYVVGSFGWDGGDIREIQCEYELSGKFLEERTERHTAYVALSFSVAFDKLVGPEFQIRFRHQQPDGPIIILKGMDLIMYVLMDLHRAGYIEYTETAYRLFAVDPEFHLTFDELLAKVERCIHLWEEVTDEYFAEVFLVD